MTMADVTIYKVFLSLGSAGVLYGLAELRRAHESPQWPVCEAVVLDVTIKESRGAIGGPRCRPVVRYEYSYGGATYEGRRIMFSASTLSAARSDMERFLEPVQPGARINVHVCPRNPRISVILPGINGHLKLFLCIASYFTFLGCGGLLGWWK
jgi:hypothetical protein